MINLSSIYEKEELECLNLKSIEVLKWLSKVIIDEGRVVPIITDQQIDIKCYKEDQTSPRKSNFTKLQTFKIDDFHS